MEKCRTSVKLRVIIIIRMSSNPTEGMLIKFFVYFLCAFLIFLRIVCLFGFCVCVFCCCIVLYFLYFF